MALRQLNHVTARTSDLEATLRFYESVVEDPNRVMIELNFSPSQVAA
jgi:predicted enzyme related to lactoylglutathione lyase